MEDEVSNDNEDEDSSDNNGYFDSKSELMEDEDSSDNGYFDSKLELIKFDLKESGFLPLFFFKGFTTSVVFGVVVVVEFDISFLFLFKLLR